jgi:hypothetical protein
LFAVKFLKAVEINWKKNIFEGQVEIIREKLKKFGVHRYTPQNTADDWYQGGPLPPPPVQVGLKVTIIQNKNV